MIRARTRKIHTAGGVFVQGRFWQEASSELRWLGRWNEDPGCGGQSDTVGQGVSLGGVGGGGERWGRVLGGRWLSF